MFVRSSAVALVFLAGCMAQPSGNGAGVTSGADGGAAVANGCTYTQGFWKTHPNAWPVSSLTLGGVSYSQAQLETIFETAPKGDASLVLAHQLIAALLNTAAGATAPAAVATAISQAQAWLAANLPAGGSLGYGTPSSSTAGAEAIALAGQLDGFNMGMAGLPHCGDSAGGGDSGTDGNGGGSSSGGSGGGGNCANGCSDGGVDPCATVTCPTSYSCFQGICQPPVI